MVIKSTTDGQKTVLWERVRRRELRPVLAFRRLPELGAPGERGAV